MLKKRKFISVFEHQSLRLNQKVDDVVIDEKLIDTLQKYQQEKKCKFFDPIYHGVRFKQHVGVIQVGEVVIEVLPKADNIFSAENETEQKKLWHSILIDMLFAVGVFNIHAPSISSLKHKTNSILDLYFLLFIEEVEYILHRGLTKKYRKKEGNQTALKGNLLFSKNIQQNLTHGERFYVRYTTYDHEHLLHAILYKTLLLLKKINTNAALHSRIGALLLNFPEMPDVKVTENTFTKISFNRKTLMYKNAVEIARMLLLQYHPDLSRGRNDVLALMFDMNLLWERFVYVSLRKHKNLETRITAQTSKAFWQPDGGYRTNIRPDILIETASQKVVLDTKWKNLDKYKPSADDLQQMFVYHTWYDAQRVALLYPGSETRIIKGRYFNPATGTHSEKECSILPLKAQKEVKQWQKEISERVFVWVEVVEN